MEHGIISITLDGTTYSASYELKRGIVTVRTDIGTRSATLDNSLPDIIARMLLREIIQSEKLRREGIL